MTEDERYMKKAIAQAKVAASKGDVPIGCVIVRDGKVLCRAHNKRNQKGSVLGHAEISAIEKASKLTGDWRLEDCVMYVTLEPCQMCAGAIVQARIPKVYIGCMNKKAGCAGSILNLLDEPRFNHQVETVVGVCEDECSAMMSDFFRELRMSKKS